MKTVVLTLFLSLVASCLGRARAGQHSSLMRKLKLSMVHLKPKKRSQLERDRELIPTLIQKAIQDSGIKAYPEFKYKNIQGGDMNIILAKSRPFMVYNTYPIIQHKVDTNYHYLSPPVMSQVPSINV